MMVQINDIQMHYVDEGPRTAPVVLMAHAMGTSYRIWDNQAQVLEDRFRVIRYDWRGHGDTDAPPGPYTLEQFVSDTAAFIDELALAPVHFVGISTGGMIGQGMGIEHSDLLASLTLCNTMARSNPWYRDWVDERQAVVKSEGMVPVWEMTKRLWFNDEFIAEESHDYCVIRDVFTDTQIPGYLGGTTAVADLDYLDQLDRIQTPTLIIAAGDDPVTPVERAQLMHERIAGSRLAVIDGQRHFSNVEVPTEFNAVLESFLDERTEQSN